MYYASFGMLALILHLIINYEAITKKRDEITSVPLLRYRHFLFAIMIYYVSDILWGFFEESRIVVLAYSDTVLYFISMALSVLVWTRYLVAYIGQNGSRSRALLYTGWTLFTLTVLTLIVNFFYPVIFDFTAQEGYIPLPARYVIFTVLFLLHATLSVYAFLTSLKRTGKDKIQYLTVSVSGAVMSVFIVLQTMYPWLPYYAVGLLVSTCLIHVFVEEDKKKDKDLRLQNVEKKAELAQKETVTFGQIAESLASNYDAIYYVDAKDGSYIGYNADSLNGLWGIDRSGDDFFADTRADIPTVVHPHDVERMKSVMDKDYIISVLDSRKQFLVEYRLMVGGVPKYTRLSARKTGDSGHYIFGVENIDDEVRKEKEHFRALNTEKELARRDELTGTKNKTAFNELEQSVQNNIDRGVDYLPFALVVCDINDLKKVNDEQGHMAGDEYIKAASNLLCDVFHHSPVFRVGGDEFVIFIQGQDYSARDELMAKLHDKVMENVQSGDGPVVASGMSEFVTGEDSHISEVFERADNAMYENKHKLKKQG